MANGRNWSICAACLGRIHFPECTVKRNPKNDCCEARHKHLIEWGLTDGIGDNSLAMNETWAD
jgi:hypothetical protein